MTRVGASIAIVFAGLALAVPAQAADRGIDLLRGPNGFSLSEDFEDVSDDGSTVFVGTETSLAAADGDTAFDVYAVKDGAATLVSDRVQAGAEGADDAAYTGASADASHVFFETTEPLVAADGDTANDVYEWTAAGTSLVSDRVQAGPDATKTARFLDASKDGSRVFFVTDEPIVAADGDGTNDIYMRAGGVTTLLSDRVQAGADATKQANFEEISEDGSVLAFRTEEPLVATDDDAEHDVYTVETGGGQPTLASGRQTGAGPSNNVVLFGDLSADGGTVAFVTTEPLTAGDGDTVEDVYLRSGGQTARASGRRQFGGGPAVPALSPVLSPSGATVFFRTDDSLLAADTDSSRDVYAFRAGDLTLISDDLSAETDLENNASLAFATDGGAYFTTAESLTAADHDTQRDIYFGDGTGEPTVATDSPLPEADEQFSVDPFVLRGTHLTFRTRARLLASDTDGAEDLYERDGDELRLVTGPAASGVPAETTPDPRTVSDDGGKVVFRTSEALTASDADGADDLYVSAPLPPAPPPAGGGGGGGGAQPPAPPASPPVLLDRLAPALSRLSAPKKITAGKAGTISFRLSEPAKVTLTFKRKRGKKLVSAGSQRVTAKAGTTKVKTSKKLKPGAYELTVVAVDAAGNKAAARKAKFSVVKAKKRKR